MIFVVMRLKLDRSALSLNTTVSMLTNCIFYDRSSLSETVNFCDTWYFNTKMNNIKIQSVLEVDSLRSDLQPTFKVEQKTA